MKAWEQVARDLPEARLVLVGGGPLRTALETQLPPRATLAGAQPLTQVPIWMAASDVVVLPSHIEGMPNAVLEALACGRRVVASAVGGVPDVITSDAVGALVPPRQPDALAAALTQALRTGYAAAAVAEAGARGGWEASAAALHAVLVAAADASVR
jgi:glycosyltransferase involved in cell wall biosynthesis